MTLAQTFSHIWDCLRDATHAQNPLNTVQLATLGLDGSPNVRTVLLREANERANTLGIHTDIRSIKVSELKADPRVAIVAMDAHRGLQIRTRGIADFTPGDTKAWQSSGDRNLVQYRTVLPPGTPVDTPGDALAVAREKHGPTDGLEHFCVVAVHLTEIDWLDLSIGKKPVRARYVMRDGAWDGTWTVP